MDSVPDSEEFDGKLHLELMPPQTIYKAEKCLEAAEVCVGLVFRDARNGNVTVVMDSEARTLTEGEARQLMRPR